MVVACAGRSSGANERSFEALTHYRERDRDEHTLNSRKPIRFPVLRMGLSWTLLKCIRHM